MSLPDFSTINRTKHQFKALDIDLRRFSQAEEDAGLEAALRHAEAREKEMQKVRSSDLYLEWQRLFSSHLRAGGTLQDFSTEVFLKEVPWIFGEDFLMFGDTFL